jgi:hypothetical protein
MKNAMRILGIPLHPLGEINIMGYYVEYSNKGDDYKNSGNQLQLVSGAIMGYIFIYNVIVSGKMVMNRPRAIAPWCCHVPSMLGTVANSIYTWTTRCML